METTPSPGRLAVGLVFLALLAWAVLRAGAAVSAPPALGAAWARAGAAACQPAAPRLELSQSGVFLDLRWPGGPAEVLHGRLDGERFELVGAGTACPGEVRVAGLWTPRGLDATVTAPGCSCDGAPLRAEPAAP